MNELMQPERAFDYSRYLGETAQILQDNANSLRGRKSDMILAIGRAVIEAKRLLPHGELQEYVSLALGVDPRYARKCVNVVDTLGHVDRSTLANMAAETLFHVSSPSFPPEAITPALELAADGPITIGDVKELEPKRSDPTVLDDDELTHDPDDVIEMEIEADLTNELSEEDWEDVDDDDPIRDVTDLVPGLEFRVSIDDLAAKMAEFPATDSMRALWRHWDATQQVSASLFLRSSESEPSVCFDDFWAAYPPKRKRDKKKAKAAFDKAVKEGANPEEIIEAAKAYAESDEGKGEFCPGPVPWLNGGRWEDDRSSWNSTTTNTIRGYLEE